MSLIFSLLCQGYTRSCLRAILTSAYEVFSILRKGYPDEEWKNEEMKEWKSSLKWKNEKMKEWGRELNGDTQSMKIRNEELVSLFTLLTKKYFKSKQIKYILRDF